jgi:V8-like Glu-specific endopeptidase
MDRSQTACRRVAGGLRRQGRTAAVLGVLIFAVTARSVPASGEPGAGGKLLPQPPRTLVGLGQPLAVVPDPGSLAVAGGRWSYTIEIAGASFLKPHLVDVNLRAGDVLRLRSASGRVVEEIVGRGPRGQGSFWGLSAFGSRLTLELAFRHAYTRPPFRIDQVIVGDPGLFSSDPVSSDPAKTVCSEPDFEDVVCYQSDAGKWANVQATVGIMTVNGNPNGALFCTGSNVSGLGQVLTNFHCIGDPSQCLGAEIVFGFHRTDCNDGSPATTEWQSFRCDEVLAVSPFFSCDAGDDDLDFSLLSVLGDPTSTFGAAVADDTPLADGEPIYIVQHPAGRPKEITHGSDLFVQEPLLRYFGTLDTEPGSSGSPIFRESDDKLVGLHHCGGCDGPEGNRGVTMVEIMPLIEEHLCTEEVVLRGAGIADLAEVRGNGNGVIDAGETWRFSPQVRNASCGEAAMGVVAEVRLNPSSIAEVSLLDTEVEIDTLGPGQSVSSSPIRFEVGETAPCSGGIVFDLVDLAAAGTDPFPDTPGLLDESVGELPKTTLFYEGFTEGTGNGWTVVDGGTGRGPASTWTTENPGERKLPFAVPFAIADSDELGIGEMMNEQLISPPIDASGYDQVELQYVHQFNWYPLGTDEKGDVAVRSSATGGDWVDVANYSGARTEGVEIFDVSTWAAGQTDVELRFHYYDARWEWWWVIDDVFLLGNNGFVCEPYLSQLFSDGLESGDLSAWSVAMGEP